MANRNLRIQHAIISQALTDGTSYYNGAETTETSAQPLHVLGQPSIEVNIGAVGVSAASLSLSALVTDAAGVTGSALTIGGVTSASLDLETGTQVVDVDRALINLEKLIVKLTPDGDDVTAGVNVLSTAPNSDVASA